MNKQYISQTPITEVVDYSANVPFYRHLTICEHTLTSNDELNPITGIGLESHYYPVPGYRAIYRLISDGTHAPTFGANFTAKNLSSTWDLTLNAVNVIEFVFDGADYIYSIDSAGAATAEASKMIINAQTSTYELLLSDAGKVVTVTHADAKQVTVPPEVTKNFVVGTVITVAQLGAGQVEVVQGAGVTIRSKDANKKLTGQYSVATLLKIGVDTWLLFGDLTA